MSEQSHRLLQGGRIDRSRPLDFTLRRQALRRAIAGDTLASALLANGVHLVGAQLQVPPAARHHDAPASEEPNALVQLRTGDRTEPKSRATEIELYEGLVAREPAIAGRRCASTSAA